MATGISSIKLSEFLWWGDRNAKKRVHVIHDNSISDTHILTEDLHGEQIYPIIYLIFEFLKSPTSSFPATAWCITMLLFVIARILLIAVESLDGPAKYHTRQHNNSFYSFIPDGQTLWSIYLLCVIPQIIDSSLRALVLLLVYVA